MKQRGESYLSFQIFTVFTATVAVPVVLYVLLEHSYLKPDLYPEHYYTFMASLFLALFVMWTWSYLSVCFAKSARCTDVQVGYSGGYCEKCKITRPDRAHHCSACGFCVAKMDHHCVWTNRCISYYNYKAFILFVFYLSLGTLVYDYLALQYMVSEKPPKNALVKIFVFALTIVALISTFLTISLLAGHIAMVLNNVSTIEYMKGKTLQIPCKEPDPSNYHNVGTVPNFLQVFGKNPFLWLVPTQTEGSAQFFPVVPPPHTML